MKKFKRYIFFAILFSCVSLNAQDRFGYIAFNNTLKLMPEYLEAELLLQKIQSDYREEIDRSKREFDRQYSEFIIEQGQLSSTIIAKRQKELQLLMDNNIEFKNNVILELENKRNDLLIPLRQKLMLAIKDVSDEMDLDWVIDTEMGTYLYINNERGVDITHPVYRKLKIEDTIETSDTIGEKKNFIKVEINQE